MNIKTVITTTLGMLLEAMQICADAAQASMPLVTRTHKGGLFFNGNTYSLLVELLGVLGNFHSTYYCYDY